MEWQGIDLSANRKNNWFAGSDKGIKNVIYTLLLSALISLALIFLYLQKIKKFNRLHSN
ncbi:hypothetical protein [Mannheimia haemolytica]|uniref:hypothetical protein n=1 Tax=Mannheimia haemolytica TaxID=75985 RepID=UPI001EFF1015|nr:hypothetical protein [Mannheimia haemolytica]